MSTVTRRRLEDYDRSLSKVEAAAGRSAMAAFSRWRAKNLNASVSEVREEMKDIVLAELDTHGNAACELAARFYDQCVSDASADLEPASIPDVPKEASDAIDKRCRWIVGRIVDEGEGGAI